MMNIYVNKETEEETAAAVMQYAVNIVQFDLLGKQGIALLEAAVAVNKKSVGFVPIYERLQIKL